MSKNRKQRKRRNPKANAAPSDPNATKPKTSASRWIYLGIFSGVTGVVITYLVALSFPVGELDEEENGNGTTTASAVTTEDDPTQDGWDSEVLSQAAQDKVKQLVSQLVSTPSGGDYAIDLSSDFTGSALIPAEQVEAFNEDGLTASRIQRPAASTMDASGWRESLRSLAARFEGADSSRYEVKVFGIQGDAAEYVTDIRIQANATHASRSLQIQTVWRCSWATDKQNETRLTKLSVEEFEQIENLASDRPMFVDCTNAAMRDVAAFSSQLQPGYEEWFRRMPRIFDRKLWAEHGLTLGDANGDGLDDVYVCEPGGLPNRLLVQRPDGSLKDISSDAGVDWYDQTRSALFVDLDNDGDQDLVVAITGRVLLMENDGAGRFKTRLESTEAPAAHAMGAADYDNDGNLDLYVCSYYEQDAGAEDYQVPIPYNDATNGGRNILLRNDGDWRFEDVTSKVGLDEANNRWSLAASWEDFDNDGDQDLYIANDFGRNCLYENRNGQFRNIAAAARVEDVGSGMSVAWADYNGDGLMDLYVSNMYSTAGGRITNQEQFQTEATAEEKARFRRMAKGNTLFTNQGDGTFSDDSEPAGVARARWAWGAPFIDINNDGWEDLIVANGFLTREDTRDL